MHFTFESVIRWNSQEDSSKSWVISKFYAIYFRFTRDSEKYSAFLFCLEYASMKINATPGSSRSYVFCFTSHKTLHLK
jgi:hypothetical protein